MLHRGGTCQQMGDFSEKGHKIWDWQYDVNKCRLYQIKEDRINIYEQEHSGIRQLRRPNRWRQRRTRARQDHVPGRICSVKKEDNRTATIIAHLMKPPDKIAPRNFQEVLIRWERTWMWDNLIWVGDDDWIREAIRDKSCITVTNGSYMKHLFPSIHSVVLVLECSKGQGRLWCSFPEQSSMVCSYRGELVGLMAIYLLLLAVNEVTPTLTGLIHIYSDCLGALDKVKNLPPSRIPAGWSHSDVL